MRNVSQPSCRLRRAAALVACLAAGSAASAQTSEEPWYTVELIVFEQLDSAGLFGERWPLDPGRPAIEEALVLTPPGGEADATPTPTPFELLGEDDLSLRETWSRLRRSRGFRPLLHVAWRQPGYPRESAPTARLTSGPPGAAAPASPAQLPTTLETIGALAPLGPPPEKIDGVVRLYRSRYLHLEADLLYHRPEAATITVEVAPDAIGRDGIGPDGAGPDGMGPDGTGADGIAPPPTPTLFRMTTSRRMRSRELHYLDHPLFGVIALVTPIEFELEPEQDQDEDLEPVPEDAVTTPLPPREPAPAS